LNSEAVIEKPSDAEFCDYLVDCHWGPEENSIHPSTSHSYVQAYVQEIQNEGRLAPIIRVIGFHGNLYPVHLGAKLAGSTEPVPEICTGR
jgi:predicted  nucleic acid-binding Zn ribbon protein